MKAWLPLVATTLATLAVWSIGLRSIGRAEAPRPNVVVLLSDDLGGGSLATERRLGGSPGSLRTDETGPDPDQRQRHG